MKKYVPISILCINVLYNIFLSISIYKHLSIPSDSESALSLISNSLNLYLSYHLIYLTISMLICISLIILLLSSSKWILKIFWTYILIGLIIQISNIFLLRIETWSIVINILIYLISAITIIFYLRKEREERRGLYLKRES